MVPILIIGIILFIGILFMHTLIRESFRLFRTAAILILLQFDDWIRQYLGGNDLLAGSLVRERYQATTDDRKENISISVLNYHFFHIWHNVNQISGNNEWQHGHDDKMKGTVNSRDLQIQESKAGPDICPGFGTGAATGGHKRSKKRDKEHLKAEKELKKCKKK